MEIIDCLCCNGYEYIQRAIKKSIYRCLQWEMIPCPICNGEEIEDD
jgi:hypothetical protein